MFKKGDEVVCIKKTPWYDLDSHEKTTGPKYGEINTIVGFDAVNGWLKTILLGGWPGDAFSQAHFRKVDRQTFTNRLTKQLANEEQVEERIDAPETVPA